MNNSKIITMTAYKRPEYTKQVIDSLSRCIGIDNYTLLIGIDPGYVSVSKLFYNIDFVKHEIFINHSLQGCSHNTYLAIARGFERSDYVIHVEDDTLLACDALLYFEHCFNAYMHDKSIFTIVAYSRSKSDMDKDSYYKVMKNKWYTPWGWATWKDRWTEMDAEWDHGISKGGWDVNLNQNVRRDRFEVLPCLARCQNIGEQNGTYCTPEHHRERQFNPFWRESINIRAGEFHE